MILARFVLPPLALESFTLSGVLLATIGTLFLAYDLLGRENGPLRWFTLVLTGGLVSTLVFFPVALLDSFLLGGFDRGGFRFTSGATCDRHPQPDKMSLHDPFHLPCRLARFLELSWRSYSQ